MSKLDHKVIDETKEAVIEVLKHMNELSGSFVDFLVQSKPSLFEQKEGAKETTCLNPFIIVELLNKQLETRFNEFRKDPEAMKGLGLAPEQEKSGDVVEFPKKPRLDS